MIPSLTLSLSFNAVELVSRDLKHAPAIQTRFHEGASLLWGRDLENPRVANVGLPNNYDTN